MEELVKKILEKDKRSAAKAITIIENNEVERKNKLLNLLYSHTGKAKVIGITGPPGAGKSTLVDGLIREIRAKGLTVGVIAIDPSSPYTGGAILGDRVRMQRHSTDQGVFIRSMGSRGKLGGVAQATKETLNVLDAMGLDVVLIETVGVGQSELEIINIADTTLVVLHPRAGDSIQAFKAGIMEVADIFVINKSDLSGAQKLMYEVETILQTGVRSSAWLPPIIKTVASEKKGLTTLLEKIDKHLAYLEASGEFKKKRLKNITNEVTTNLLEQLNQRIITMKGEDYYRELVEKINSREMSPTEVASVLFERILKCE